MNKDSVIKLVFPTLLLLVGLALLIYALANQQNTFFVLGSAGITIAGVATLLNIMNWLEKGTQLIVFGVLVVCALGLAALDYQSIKVPIEFQKEKRYRYQYVVQRLKDIREMQLAHKSIKGMYSDNFDSLMTFIQLDSFTVVVANGFVPDTLTEEKAVELGLVSRDTMKIAIQDSIFSKRNLMERTGKFYMDSLTFVPFTKGEAKFLIAAGEVERNNSKVPVFQVTDSKPFDPTDVLQVGSMTEPITSGNWGE